MPTTGRDGETQPDDGKETTSLQETRRAATVGGALKAWSTSAAFRMGIAARKSLEVTEMGLSQIGAMASISADKTTASIAEGLEDLQSLYDRGVDTVFPECAVSAFLLPTGPDPENYLLMFDLSEMLANLRSGVLVRPRIELWAARPEGYDTDRLAEELAVAFVEQFNAARTSLVEAGMQEVAAYQQHQDVASREVKEEFWGPTLGSAAFWAFALGPVTPVGLLLLWMGQRPRTEIFSLTAKYLQARSGKAAAKRNVEHEVRTLESDFGHKRKAFNRAVRRMTVRVHPQLQQVSQSFAGAGDGSDVSSMSADVPNVDKYLNNPLYRKALPKPQQESSRSGGLLKRVFGRD